MSQGAQPALSEYLLSAYDQLKRRLSRHLGCDELAGEALQDTWLRLQRMGPINPVRNPHAFLLRMAANMAVDQARSRNRAVPRGEADELLEVADPQPGPEQQALLDADMKRMMHGIQRLAPRRREVLILVRWEGLPQQEVARRLGVSLRTVEYELRQAQDQVAASLRAGERRR